MLLITYLETRLIELFVVPSITIQLFLIKKSNQLEYRLLIEVYIKLHCSCDKYTFHRRESYQQMEMLGKIL